MFHRIMPITLMFCLALHPGTSTGAENAGALEKARLSVVSIRGHDSKKGGAHSRVGSGFVFRKGLVVTRRNVIADADSIFVFFTDGRSVLVPVVYRDSGTDVVLLRIPFDEVPCLEAGRSDNLSRSESLTILGNAMGIFPSVTLGAFSGKRDDGLLEIDCRVPPGNCGGPVLDPEGRLVGMVLGRVHKEQGIEKREAMAGIALPVETVASVVRKFADGSGEAPGWIGISIVDLEYPYAERGVRVVRLNPDGPAEKAGICIGDTVVQMDGHPVKNARELAKKARKIEPDSKISFSILKGKTVVQKQVKAGRHPSCLP